ncbi:CPBP family intramembrane metalloprotease [Patescibacteria group bacterium]|nr:MAG: CPBP family intramembrane metalloprotease [Patescibacteria group bacterium]
MQVNWRGAQKIQAGENKSKDPYCQGSAGNVVQLPRLQRKNKAWVGRVAFELRTLDLMTKSQGSAIMSELITKWQRLTSRVEPLWTLIGAPVIQEFIFRLVPYKLYLSYGGFYMFGILSSVFFASIHWYFGKWFVVYSFAGGLVLWFVIVNYGFLLAVILHALANLVLLSLGILRKVKDRSTVD